MTLINKTASTITVLAKDIEPTELKPNESFDLFSRMFDGISIHSNEGSCIIFVAYGDRECTFFGDLILEFEGPVKVIVKNQNLIEREREI